MPALSNPRWERFCALYVALGNASEAYRQAGYKFTKDVDAHAHRLTVKDSICRRVAELKAKNNRKSALSRDEALNILAEIARGPRDEFIKASDQERAIEIASRMCGWNEPDEVRLSAANSLTGYLLELRKESLNAPILEDNVFQALEDKPKPNNTADNGLNDQGVSDTISASVEAQ
jgi:hypothetical protein